MAKAVLVLGDSGAGKTFSLRSIDPDKAFLIQCINKMLPFEHGGKWKLHNKELPDGSRQRGNVVREDHWAGVLELLQLMARGNRKVIIVDDFQVVMQHENMARAYQTGYQKFTEMADHIWQIITAATNLPEDVRVYFLAHTELDGDKVRMKTCGKMLNEKLTPEGYFSTVLRCVKKDGKHVFLVKGDDNDTVKAPPDLFGMDVTEIENNLALVDDRLAAFNADL